MFEAYEANDNSEEEYFYYVNEDSGQVMSMVVTPAIIPDEYNEDEVIEGLDYFAERYEIGDDYNIYRVGDNIWYVVNSFEDADDIQSISGMYIGIKDDNIMLSAVFDVTREAEGSDRFVDSGDLLTLFKQIFDHLSVG